jgi:hypothetical protein
MSAADRPKIERAKGDGQRQVDPNEMELRMRSIAASTIDAGAKRQMAIHLIRETLSGLGYASALAAFEEIWRA